MAYAPRMYCDNWPFRSCCDCGPKFCTASRNFPSRVSTPVCRLVHLSEKSQIPFLFLGEPVSRFPAWISISVCSETVHIIPDTIPPSLPWRSSQSSSIYICVSSCCSAVSESDVGDQLVPLVSSYNAITTTVYYSVPFLNVNITKVLNSALVCNIQQRYFQSCCPRGKSLSSRTNLQVLVLGPQSPRTLSRSAILQTVHLYDRIVHKFGYCHRARGYAEEQHTYWYQILLTALYK